MPGTLPHSLPLLRRFPGPSGPILVSVGRSSWLAMRIQKQLGRSQSDCSAFPNALPPHSVGPQLDRRSQFHLCSLPADMPICLAESFLYPLAGSPLPPIFSRFRSPSFRFGFIQHRGSYSERYPHPNTVFSSTTDSLRIPWAGGEVTGSFLEPSNVSVRKKQVR